MNSIRRVCCSLPKTVQGFCEMGCIYREKAFRHLACPKTRKLDGCAAPCNDFCDCNPTKTNFELKPQTKKEKNEVFLL